MLDVYLSNKVLQQKLTLRKARHTQLTEENTLE